MDKNTNNECSDTESKKLRILAIHGYRQNATIFKQKIGSFRKMVNKWAQFTFITAPHKVINLPDESQINIVSANDVREETGKS